MILILGVTASGKATLAFDLAKKCDAEIICADSMKVYRRMDIGTAKPSLEAQKQIKYHLIDIVEPSESFSVAAYCVLANKAIEKIKQNNKTVIAVGGTAMYIKALLFGLFEGPASDESIRKQLKKQAEQMGLEKLHNQLKEIDPQAAQNIHQNDAKRIIRALEVYELTGKPISSFQKQWGPDQAPKDNWTIIGLRRSKEIESQRINARVKKIIGAGIIDEVKALLAEEKPISQQARCAIGYAEIIQHLKGECALEDAIELIKKNTRRFAKGQRTWFKTFKNVNWIDIQPDDTSSQILKKAYALIK